MKGSQNIILFIFQFCILISYVIAFEGKMECKGMKIKMDDGEKAVIKACAKESDVTDMIDLSAEKMGCFSKCMLEKQGLVDDKGHPHKENILKKIDASAMFGDDKIKEVMKMAFEKCLDENGPKLKPEEKSCLSYSPLTTCIQQAFMKACLG